MPDKRFFRLNGPFALGDIARHIGSNVPIDASSDFLIHGVAALDSAGEGDVSVYSETRRRGEFQNSHASVVVTNADLSKHALNGTWLLLNGNPRFAFAQILALYYPRPVLEPGVHPRAWVHSSATIGPGSEIGAGVMIGANASIGARCHIERNAVIGEGVVIGDDAYIGANTSVSHAVVGDRVRISSNVSVGGEGFGFVAGSSGLMRVPQLGRVIIEDDVDIGGNCAIDRGAMDDTIIGAGTAIDNLVQIGHNVRIGRHCAIAGQAGIAGSAEVGDFVMIGGQVAVKDHVTIGSRARIAGRAGVMRDVAAGESVAGTPAVPVREWHRQTLALKKMSRKS
jgi:UDP-3-O-[3-hydroxymyristoyl] glucosamine N-acyltransferase